MNQYIIFGFILLAFYFVGKYIILPVYYVWKEAKKCEKQKEKQYKS